MMRLPHRNSKLTPDQVLEIRSLAGKVTQEKIAKQFRIHTSCVNQIIHRATWAWLKAPAAVVALMLFLIVGAARAEEAQVYEYPTGPAAHEQTIGELYSSCSIALGAFLAPHMLPQPDCDYPIGNVVAFQKLKGGYLLGADVERGITPEGLIALKTNAQYERGERPEGYARLSGVYEYQGLDGFPHQVWQFELVKSRRFKHPEARP